MSRVGVFGQISEISPHLFLSGAQCVRAEKIRQKSISFVVNATIEEQAPYVTGVDYLRVRVDDNPYAPLSAYFDSVADKIKTVSDRGGKTLVHCMAGVSRSATLCMVYLMKHEKMTLRQAYNHVRSRRPVVRPNVGFWKQMVDYEKKLRGTTSVQMLMTPQCDMPIPDVYCEDLKKMVSSFRESPSLSSYTPQAAYLTSKRSRFLTGATRAASMPGRSPSSILSSRPSSASSLLPLTPKFSLVSPAPSRRPRENSLFSIYASSPRSNFFSTAFISR
ncbi:unnamed protein product, partial [Mesorhabditis belari]|uniref:Protein-tyrosine-phosphatase n=1 Tax=Mesorhabditis belari TaxID=2138241 RepID=A0AAF3FA70_9BILA